MKRRVVIDRAALKAHLAEQVAFLRSSCRAFDAGEESEAKRLAVTLRVLLHDTPHSKSLLAQFGTGFTWRFADSAMPFDPRNLSGHHGLVAVRLATGPPQPEGRFVPICRFAREPVAFVPFRIWWDNAVVFKDKTGQLFTRRVLVLTMANQDGGAHVASELDAAYADLAKGNSMGLTLHLGTEDVPWPNSPVPSSVRQVAHEVLVSLESAMLVSVQDARTVDI